MILKFILLFLLPVAILTSFCGKSGVPYSFEVLSSGAPVLGCAQPSCVVLPEDFEEDSEFLTDVSGQADGFFREGDRNQKRYRHPNAPQLVANCSGGFSQLSCPRKNQWVGGIEYIDHPRQPLILQCCSFDGLRFSQEVGMTVVGPGEAITGGEVIRNGRQISFDVIANVRKIVQPGHGQKASYEVTVRRMNCLPDPPEPEVDFDKDVPSEVLKILSTAKNGKDLGAKEKFEKKVAEKKKPKKNGKKVNKKAKQHAVESETNANVEPKPTSNIEALPQQVPTQQQQQLPQQPQTAPEVPQQQQHQPQPVQPVAVPGFGAPQTLPGFPQGVPQQQSQAQPVQPVAVPGFNAPGLPQIQQQPQSVQPVALPGFGAPQTLPGFPQGGSFPGFQPAQAPYSLVAVTPAPSGFQTSTSTWEQQVNQQPPRPTYPNGVEVFPTIGTGFMTPHPGFPTFPTAAPSFGLPSAPVTPPPAIARPQGAPDQVQLPSLASPPPLNNIEQTVNNQGSGAAISNVDGGNNQAVGAAPAPAPARIEGAPSFSANQPAAFPGFQPFTFPPPAQPFQFPTFPPHPAHPGFQFPAASASGSAGAAPGGLQGLPTLPTLPPMPSFSFPTLPPAAPTTPHPLFTLPTPAPQLQQGFQQQPQQSPAQAQGTLILPGLNPIQYPGLQTNSTIPGGKK